MGNILKKYRKIVRKKLEIAKNANKNNQKIRNLNTLESLIRMGLEEVELG